MNGEYLVGLIDDLIKCREDIKQEVNKLKDKVNTHHTACNGVKTGSAIVTAIGGGLALFTGGLSLILSVGAAAVGTTAGAVTSLVDIFKSEDYVEEIQSIADRQRVPAEKLANALEKLKQMAYDLSKELNIPEDAALYVIVKGIKDPALATLSVATTLGGTAFMAAKGKLGAPAIQAFGKIAKGAGKISGTAVLKVVSTSLVVITTVWDTVDCIVGWSSDHPTIKQMDDLINDIEKGTEHLQNLRKCFLEM